jgi:hypothetical protein
MPRIHTTNLEGKTYPMAYKIVTQDMRSLGLRNNPNLHQYPLDEWYFLPSEQVVEGAGDWGGIWLCRIPSNAFFMKKYMLKKHKVKTRIFKACLADILFCNSYRIKTNGVRLFEEMNRVKSF